MSVLTKEVKNHCNERILCFYSHCCGVDRYFKEELQSNGWDGSYFRRESGKRSGLPSLLWVQSESLVITYSSKPLTLYWQRLHKSV